MILNLESSGQKEFYIEIEKDTKGSFAQHTTRRIQYEVN